MSCREVTADGVRYRLSPIDAPPLASRLQAVVRWAAIDEITEEAPDVDFVIAGVPSGLLARVGTGGQMGLVGNPARVYPGLGASGVSLSLSLSAPGYLPRSISTTLGPIPGFPGAFVAKDAGVVALHRTPIVVRGRVVAQSASPAPIGGASVTLLGVWSVAPAANVDPGAVMEPPNVVSLSPGLYAERAAAGGWMRRRDLVAVVGEDKTLARPAARGGVTIRLSDRVNLSAGDVLAIAPDDPGRVEYIGVAAVVPAATDDQPADVTLDLPLGWDHEAGVRCVRVTPQPPSPQTTIERDGIAGDRVAFCASLAAITDGVVEIGGGGPSAREFQVARSYAATTDASGFYRLPPISRVAAIALDVKAGAKEQKPVLSPDYRSYENQLDVVMT